MDKKKHKALNFLKQFKNSVCLTTELDVVKLLDFDEVSGRYLVLTSDGDTIEFGGEIIGLRSKVKNYNLIEAKFNSAVKDLLL